MTCRVGIKCFFAVLEIPVLSPRSRPSPYFPWPVENGLTMSFDEGQVCHEHCARPCSCGSPRTWIFFVTKQQSYVLVNGGKSIPWNVRLRKPCGTNEGLLFLSEMVTPPEAVARSGINVLSAHTALKTHIECSCLEEDSSGNNSPATPFGENRKEKWMFVRNWERL